MAETFSILKQEHRATTGFLREEERALETGNAVAGAFQTRSRPEHAVVGSFPDRTTMTATTEWPESQREKITRPGIKEVPLKW